MSQQVHMRPAEEGPKVAESTEGGTLSCWVRAALGGRDFRRTHEAHWENCSRELNFLCSFCLFNSAITFCYLKDYPLSKNYTLPGPKNQKLAGRKGITRLDIANGREEITYVQT